MPRKFASVPIVSDPTELVQPGGNNHSSRFVRLCVGACFIHGAG